MRIPKISLIWKLVAVNLLGVGIVIVLAWQVIDLLAADYFMGLMKEYKIDPEVLHGTFLRTTHQFLLLSMALGLGIVFLLGWFMTKRMMRSLTEMNQVTRKLALGDYSERVRVTTRDEVGELGEAFNRMVGSLEKIEAMRKDLVANVAHELRTPLHNMRGQLEAIQDRLMEASPRTIDSLHEEVLRLARLVEDLHRLSQIDSEARFMKKEPFDLHGLIVREVAREEERFKEKGIGLKIAGEPVSVNGDADQIVQVVRNLILNILQYTPENGEARIEIEPRQDRVQVLFSNSGDGIKPEDLPHVFERFYRGEKSRSREWGGAGIGLSIVKQIVEAHGGTVGADNRPGRTEVRFTLPL